MDPLGFWAEVGVKRAIILGVAMGLFAGGASAAAPAATVPATKPVATAPAEKPAAQPQPARKRPAGFNSKAQRDAQRQNIKSMPDGGKYKLTDLVRFSIAEGRLKAELVGKIPAGQQQRVSIEGSNATWVVNRFENGMNSVYSLIRYDFDAPEDDYWMVSMSFQQNFNMLTIYAQGCDNNEVMNLNFNQQPNNVMLNMHGFENNRMKQILNGRSTDLVRLRNEYPVEVRRHLTPLLRKLTLQPILNPGPSDVYKVFTAIPADPVVTTRIEALLPGLTSASPSERSTATKQLNALGQAGALAALRFDVELLLPEQVNRLYDLVALHSRMTIEDPATLLKDAFFLIDCLEDEEPVVRQQAHAALEKTLNRKVAFDLNAPADKRAAAADALRVKLDKEQPKEPKKEAAGPQIQGGAIQVMPAVRINKLQAQ